MSLSPRPPLARHASARSEAEIWFLERGLPAVLTTRGRWRRLLARSAPVLAAFATIQACGIPILLITGSIEGEPSTVEWVVLAMIAAALPLGILVGWLVPRLAGRRRSVAGITAALVAVIAGVINAVPSQRISDAVMSAAVVAVILILTGSGVASVLLWSVRMTLSHLATVGALMVRALPVVLLTTLVFFNAYVWLMAVTIDGTRLWLALAFLVSIAGIFVVSATVERVRPMLRSAATLPEDNEKLADTPFAALPDPPADSARTPLKKTERLNVVFVLAASQLVQITVVAVVTSGIYLVLGLILLNPALLKEWTHVGAQTSRLFGMTVPVPDSLINMCLFLGALTFMYISARAAGDADYRSSFLDPLIEDLHAALIARNRYRSNIAPADEVDAT